MLSAFSGRKAVYSTIISRLALWNNTGTVYQAGRRTEVV